MIQVPAARTCGIAGPAAPAVADAEGERRAHGRRPAGSGRGHRADVARPADPGARQEPRVGLGDLEQALGRVRAAVDPVRAAGHGQVAVGVDHAGHDRRAGGVDDLDGAGVRDRPLVVGRAGSRRCARPRRGSTRRAGAGRSGRRRARRRGRGGAPRGIRRSAERRPPHPRRISRGVDPARLSATTSASRRRGRPGRRSVRMTAAAAVRRPGLRLDDAALAPRSRVPGPRRILAVPAPVEQVPAGEAAGLAGDRVPPLLAVLRVEQAAPRRPRRSHRRRGPTAT